MDKISQWNFILFKLTKMFQMITKINKYRDINIAIRTFMLSSVIQISILKTSNNNIF